MRLPKRIEGLFGCRWQNSDREEVAMLCRKRFRFVGAMFAVATLFTPLVAHAAGGFSKGRFHLLGRRRRVRRHSSDRAARWRPMVFSLSIPDRSLDLR